MTTQPTYTHVSIKIHNVLYLTMDLRGLSYKQQLYKINLFRVINRTLKLRKRPGENIWEMRTGGRWIKHTSLVLVEGGD